MSYYGARFWAVTRLVPACEFGREGKKDAVWQEEKESKDSQAQEKKKAETRSSQEEGPKEVIVMKKIILLGIVLMVGLTSLPVSVSYAVWVWTPETKRWINPKYVVKTSPEEQFAGAEELFQNGEYGKAITEYRKLIKKYSGSLYAPRSQYAIGSSYEALGKYSRAVEEYQKVIDNYPASDKVADVLESQYRLGNLLFGKEIESKLKKAFAESNYEKAAKVYQLVIKNAPYSERASEVQYRIGLSYRKQGNFSEAVSEYQKVIRNYPESPWVEKAYYEIGLSYLAQSLSPLYDQTMTDSALKQFQEFRKRFPDSELTGEVEEKIKLLKGRQAERAYQIAQFYEKGGSIPAAVIYYRKVVENYPESDWAVLSRERLIALEK